MLSWMHTTLRRIYFDGQRVGGHGPWKDRQRPPEIVSLEELLGE